MTDNIVQPIIKYQWIKGDNTGTIEQLVNSVDGFMTFVSGRRINAELLHEFMIQVSSETDILDIGAPKVQTREELESMTGLKYEGSKSTSAAEPENPIIKLLEKQSKNNKIKITLEFDVNVPKKEVVELLQDSFEENVMDEVVKYSKNKLNKKDIIDKVYSQLEEHIKIYYSK
jgi:hypothetical protein